MPLFKVKKTGEIGYFSDRLRPSYDCYNQKVYYFLKIVDPNTDWTNAYAPNQYKFTGKTGRFEIGELSPISTRELKKNQKINLSIKEDVELAKSDITKIIDYSEKLQSMFDVNDNLEDWIKAKLNHAADYVMTVRDYIKFYRDEKNELQEIKNKYKKDDIDKIVDGLQYALDIVGIEPTIGTVADATNSIISILRAALEKETDDKKKHLLNAAISAVSMIPFGDLVKLIKLRVLRKPAVKLAKFINQFLKSTDPSYADDMLEVWSNRYKRSINCSNPRGFSQKAHCRARKLRQSGKQTSSKPVKEIYKEIINGLLKEYNSSMAMGSLKQINHDAKELQSILQQTDDLEDWVKAKLNLAGEYLDDIYHHLDHFKNKTTITESFYEKKLWFSPDGKVVDVGNSHEKWILKNDPSVAKGMTLIDTYENAIKKGYVRAVHDISSNFLSLSNLPNYDFSEKLLSRTVKNAIEDYVIDKDIAIVASGKGKIIHSFNFAKSGVPTFESFNKEMREGWKDLALAGMVGLSGLIDKSMATNNPTHQQQSAASQKYLYTVEDIIAATLVDEAGGEKNAKTSMHAVLNVIMNRAKGNIKNAALECLKPYQFSGWNKIHKKDPKSILSFINSKKSHPKYRESLGLVQSAKDGNLPDITHGANHFLNVNLTKKQSESGKLPKWYDPKKVVNLVGNHTFLKLETINKLGEYFGFNYYF